MYPLKQSTALTVPFFAHDVNGDGVTGLVDAGFTKRISKDGGAFAAMTVTISELENGWYSLPLSTAHSDTLGLATVSLSHASIKRVNLQFRVHARLPDDLATPTNITAGTITTVTTLTNLPAITANWLTAVGIAAAALNGKGDWNIGKTGYALSTAGVQAIWDALTSALTAAGSIGKKLADWVLGSDSKVILSNNAHTGAVVPTVTAVTNDVGVTQAGADKVWASATRTLTAFSTALALSVWDVLETAIATASSIGLKVKTNLDAAISSRSTYAGGDTAGTTTLLGRIPGTVQPQTGDSFARLGAPAGASVSADVAAVKAETASIQADTNDLRTRLPAALVGGKMDANTSAIDGNTAAAANLKQSTLGIVTAVVGAGSTTTSIVTSSMSPAAAVTDQFKGKIVTFAEDTTTVNLRGQSTDITASTAAGVLTVTALTTAPASGDTCAVT